ncbi:hypothetical protein KUF71_010200 [Frankliniella fusca]|uniref:RNA-directed DNA polymerase n=1 Tax=Frankliniella fusca TaxID=407009 RepID=A0AAE1HI37_9NEOP|nr:hypothetical protein KUF71_010200 [Frankliniella fusca]
MPDNARPPAPNVKPPEEFSFIPSDWVDWKSRFSQYHMLAQLDRQSEEYQANSLLYIMGQRANQVVATLDLTAAEKKNYTRLMEALDALYKATKNTVYDRAKFFRRSQQPGEPAAEFIMDVKKLATPCEFGDLKDSLIRDIIILGIRDEALSQALVLDATLNLEKCVDRVLNAEQVSQSSPAAREGNGNGNGQEVHKVKVPFKKNQRPFQQNKQKNWKCKYCGRPEKHSKPDKCPAWNKSCKLCGKKNHFAEVCRSTKKIHEMEEGADDEGEDVEVNAVFRHRSKPRPFLGEVKSSGEIASIEDSPLLLDIEVGGLGTLEFKADSGADGPVFGREYLSQLAPVKLYKCAPLKAAGDLVLEVYGKFKAKLSWNGKSHVVWVYVMQRKQKPLLGRPTMIKFGLIDPTVYKPVKILAASSPNNPAVVPPEVEYSSVFTGKELYTPDILSRAPLPDKPADRDILLEELLIAELASANRDSWPMSTAKLQELRKAQAEDPVCQQIKTYILQGWPKQQVDLSNTLKPFHAARNDLNIQLDMICKGNQLLIPKQYQPSMLQGLHTGHLSVEKCRSRAASAVWWPSMTAQLSDFVQKCPVCLQRRKLKPEPLLPTPPASRPWEMIAMDLADCKGRKYLVVVDYFSTYPFALEMRKTTAAPIITQLENLFSMFGSPEVIRSDNGPPFNSWDFKRFCETWDITHTTSSPHFPQSNGKAEAAVKIVKEIIQRGEILTGLLAYRDAKLKIGFTPAQLFLGRHLRTTVPSLPTRLEPSWPDFPKLRTLLNERNAAAKKRFDQAKRAKELAPLQVKAQVWITDLQTYGTITGEADSPRSYYVSTGGRILRRNRRNLLDATALATRLGPYQYPPVDAEPKVTQPPPHRPTQAASTPGGTGQVIRKRRSLSPGGRGRGSRPQREIKKPGHLEDFVL